MLDIYRASAGSGKTYTLTLEYIKMLLGRRDNDGQYKFYDKIISPHRHILAVTFTNKATDEMKQRIVKQLDVLAHDTTQSAYCRTLCDTFACTPQKLQQVALTVLRQLLHDFSLFSVSTIDSFFQQVLRAFTREVGLQGGFDVEMDEGFVTASAIGRMMDDLEKDENHELLQWIMQLAEANIRDGNSWNVANDDKGIPKLAKQLNSETYKKYREQLLKLELSDFDAFGKAMDGIKKNFCDTLISYVQPAKQAIEQLGYPTEAYSRSWPQVLDKLVDYKGNLYNTGIKTVRSMAAAPDSWFKKASIKKYKIDIDTVRPTLQPCLQNIAEFIDQNLMHYYSAIECKKNLHALGVLTHIDRHIMEYEQEHNTLLLNKTPEILSGIIDESDAPFIYEKIGTRIDHYLIDEFQDTSRLQWTNFEPLVNESLANNNDNLIVGDVKQSIYRWRNSDWRLLHYAFDPASSQCNMHTMDTNWRSCKGIVEFNNSFFNTAAQVVQEHLHELIDASALPAGHHLTPDIATAYASLAQKVAPANVEHTGHVRIEMIKGKAGSNGTMKNLNKDEYFCAMAPHLIQMLTDLLQRGYRMRDIALLVRTNSDGKKLVDFLLDLAKESTGILSTLRVISDDALIIFNAQPVKLIIDLLQHIDNPQAPLYKLLLAYENALMGPLNRGTTQTEALQEYFEHGSTLEEELVTLVDEVKGLPLYEMCERIIAYFSQRGYMDNYVAYIETFQDIVQSYCSRYNADLHTFLKWWKDKEEKSQTLPNAEFAIKSPDDLNAVRVITIHKAKGLEFPVVIIPFAQWKFSRDKNNLIWCNAQEPPYDMLPALPLNMGKELSNTIFAEQYLREVLNNYIDNLNLAYVAFTRAIETLIVYTGASYTNGISDIKDLISIVVKSPAHVQGDLDLSQHCREEEDCYVLEIGAGHRVLTTDQPAEEPPAYATYHVTPPGNRMRLRLRSHNPAGDDARDYGNLMHNIMARIRYSDDVVPTVQQFVRDGELSAADAPETIERLHHLLSLPRVSPWFRQGVRVLNETEILQAQSTFYRPDRVVIDGNRVTIIDYKFGNTRHDSTYRKQIANYMSLVSKMGYEQVEGYIWYVSLQKIVSSDGTEYPTEE